MWTTAYVTPQALVDAFGERELVQLTDRADPRAGEVDYAIVQRACDRAGVEVDAAISTRYAVPLASVPELLRHLAADLAHFYLFDVEPPALVKMRFDAARQMLRELAAGRQSLGVDLAGAAVAGQAQDLAVMTAGAKDFARGTW